jgi:formylglycine-generating enzyme required for sulfatase activity
MKTKEPLIVISIIFVFLLACQTLVAGVNDNDAPTQTQETISQPTAALISTEVIERIESTAFPVIDITDDFDVSMVLVPEGEFVMGSDNGEPNESPSHIVYLDAYYIDKYEVTNALYRACIHAGACKPSIDTGTPWSFEYGTSYSYRSYPFLTENWNQAKTYCEWRGAQLPTEAQWEKAARGTDGRSYPWGDELDCSKANFNGCDVYGTTEVGSYKNGKSPYGLYDMAGNAREWVADWYSEDYYLNSPFSNPLGPESGDELVLRGGSITDKGNDVRSTYRFNSKLTNPAYSYDIGFRCARTP